MTPPSMKGLIISIGSDPAAATFTLNRLSPEALCFFVSEGRRGETNREIIPVDADGALSAAVGVGP
ncbi:MAG: hypothetical protein HY282_17175 [Nitrospirae bacterium]|nr:hypothetical protein [Candidatus Manganitrophaceae bacterium]